MLRTYASYMRSTVGTRGNNTSQVRLYDGLIVKKLAPKGTLFSLMGGCAGVGAEILLHPECKSCYCSRCRFRRLGRRIRVCYRVKTSKIIVKVLGPSNALSARRVTRLVGTTKGGRGTLRHTFSIYVSPVGTLRRTVRLKFSAVLADKRGRAT